MKTIIKISIALLFAALLYTCNQAKNGEQENSLDISRVSNTDSLSKVYNEVLDEINQNLEVIRQKEGLITLGPNSNIENGISTKDKILRDIKLINSLLEENEMKIDQLNTQLKQNKSVGKNINQRLAKVTQELNAKKVEIKSLKNQLAKLEFDLSDLQNKYTALELKQVMLEDSLSSLQKKTELAYYAFGKATELSENGIIKKEGGILWFGKTKQLDDNFNEDYFTQINIKETQKIPLLTKKAKLLTTHPDNSYQLTEQNDLIAYLEITDPEEFWKANRYLVIETK